MIERLLNFSRRALSRYADDKAVNDFTKVARAEKLPLDWRRKAEPPTDAEVLDGLHRLANGDPDLEAIAKQIGQIR